jgi:hypothetical protein
MNRKFENKVVSLYTVVYDADPDKVYSFCDFDKALASIESSVRGYAVDDNEVVDQMTAALIKEVVARKEFPCIPIIMNELQIILYRWELDQFHPIHKVLTGSYNQVNDTTKDAIEILFGDPAED